MHFTFVIVLWFGLRADREVSFESIIVGSGKNLEKINARITVLVSSDSSTLKVPSLFSLWPGVWMELCLQFTESSFTPGVISLTYCIVHSAM